MEDTIERRGIGERVEEEKINRGDEGGYDRGTPVKLRRRKGQETCNE